MTPLRITCTSCHRGWALSVGDSLYLELDLASRPCPHCEAYTLSCPGRAVAAPPPRGHRAGQQVSFLVPRPVAPWQRQS
jgi:hypothetical protein